MSGIIESVVIIVLVSAAFAWPLLALTARKRRHDL